MDKKPYKVTRPDTDWIAGKRVQDGVVHLTETEAEHDLARGNIELDAETTAVNTPVIEDDGEKTGKARKAREA